MLNEFLSSEEFLKSVKGDEGIRRGDGYIVAAVKTGEGDHAIHVSLVGLGEWIEMPVRMIESAKSVGTALAGADRYPVALIKLREPDDVFAKAAYQMLAQMSSVAHLPTEQEDCGCCGKKDAHEDDDVSEGAIQRLSGGRAGGLSGGFGGFGIGGKCRWEFRCYDCTRCIPWTNICWSSTCCDLVKVDCEVSV